MQRWSDVRLPFRAHLTAAPAIEQKHTISCVFLLDDQDGHEADTAGENASCHRAQQPPILVTNPPSPPFLPLQPHAGESSEKVSRSAHHSYIHVHVHVTSCSLLGRHCPGRHHQPDSHCHGDGRGRQPHLGASQGTHRRPGRLHISTFEHTDAELVGDFPCVVAMAVAFELLGRILTGEIDDDVGSARVVNHVVADVVDLAPHNDPAVVLGRMLLHLLLAHGAQTSHLAYLLAGVQKSARCTRGGCS
mmetsp:Transcript_54019/g.135802  ORF Transcript_54019/g.135802 Transcript_54019/m.135802 type:complete len:247 (+) Transcript_54019:240-980(+)